MSDINEEQKRLYKRAEENDLKAKMKPLFPEDVEMICISKDDYDRLYGDLTYENIELQNRINKAYKVLDKLTFYTTSIGQVVHLDMIISDIKKVKSILKGSDKE